MTGRLFSIALASLTLAAATARAQPGTYDRFSPIVKNVTWFDCTSDTGDGEFACAYVDVPLDYKNISAGKASLAVAKLEATKSPRLGSIFLNPGGPGGSGVELVMGGYGTLLQNVSGGQYDLIGWDPRGVGSTFPGDIACFNSSSEESTFWNGTAPVGVEFKGNFTNPDGNDPDVVAFWAQEPELDSLLTEFGERCLEINGDILQFLGTAANVRDIAYMTDLFDGEGALINFMGFSYGTVIGQFLVNMFPERVGRQLIDGVVNIELYANAPAYDIWSYAIQDTDAVFGGFLAGCAAAGPNGCAIAGSGSTAATIKEWILELKDDLFDFYQAGGDFGSSQLVNLIFQALYHPTQWPTLASDIYDIADQLYNGSGSGGSRKRAVAFVPKKRRGEIRRRKLPQPFHEFVQHRRRSIDSHIAKRSESGGGDGGDDTPQSYSFQAITCADAIDAGNTTTKDVFQEIIFAATNSSELFGPGFGSGGFYCHKWLARATERYTGPYNADLKNPILVVGNKADPITPLAGAVLAADLLGDKSAVLVEQDDFGHTSLAEHSDCTMAILSAYFQHGTLPKQDQFCGTEQELFPTKSITKSYVQSGISSDPKFDPSVSIPSRPGGGEQTQVLGSDVNDGGNPSPSGTVSSGLPATTVIQTTATVTVTSPANQDEINSLKATRTGLLAAVGAMGLALLLILGGLIFTIVRNRSGGSRGRWSSVGLGSAKSSGAGGRRGAIPVDLDGDDDAFLPPSSKAVEAEKDASRASMETLRGYSDPYDPPSSALGSQTIDRSRSPYRD